MASLEVEKAGLVVPPLNFAAKLSQAGNVVLTWKDRSFNAVSFIIEREKESKQDFKEIAVPVPLYSRFPAVPP